MRSFKEYWNEHGDVYAMEIAEDAWDYQQAKIDELQKRVDAALKMISINRGFAWGSVSISQLEQALKGES